MRLPTSLISSKTRLYIGNITPQQQDQETEILRNYFDIPLDQLSVKEVFDCSIKNSHGKLFICQSILCWVGKKKFGAEVSKVWCLDDILDLSEEGTKSFKVTDLNKSHTFTGFHEGTEGRDKALKSVRRLFFGPTGNSPIHCAVANSQLERVKAILDRDVTKLMEYNRNEQTPLILACVNNDKDMVNLLLSYYSNSKEVDINQTTTKGSLHQLHSICRLSDIDDTILETLVKFPGINVSAKVEYDKTTPLHYFCVHNHSVRCAEIGKLFIEAGADVNARTEQGETPLHKAIFNTRVKVIMIQMLLSHKAKVDVKGGQRGDTPLHYAIRLERIDLVNRLLEASADITIKNNEDKDCLQIAREEAKLENKLEKIRIVNLLESVETLLQILSKANSLEYADMFISNKLYELDVLCMLDEEKIQKLGFDIKMGPKIKLLREIELLREDMEKKKKIKELDSGKLPSMERQGSIFSADAIRSVCDMENGKWEIDSEDLEFTAKLGSGTSGQVFRGLFKGSEVAIKILHAPDSQTNFTDFKKEFEILTAVKSPHIVKFFGASLEPQLCMVMEFCHRGSLFDVLYNNRSISWSQAISFATDMAKGLSDLHTHDPPIIHRDLKSLNLLVTRDWKIKLCDFGLSRIVAGDQATFTKLCGTYAYCAPEIFVGKPASVKSDVYSMGMVLWEILNTVVRSHYTSPFSEYGFGYEFQIIVKAAQGLRPAVPQKSPRSLVKLYFSCVHPNPQKRLIAKEVSEQLKKIKGEYEKNSESWEKDYFDPSVDCDGDIYKFVAIDDGDSDFSSLNLNFNHEEAMKINKQDRKTIRNSEKANTIGTPSELKDPIEDKVKFHSTPKKEKPRVSDARSARKEKLSFSQENNKLEIPKIDLDEIKKTEKNRKEDHKKKRLSEPRISSIKKYDTQDLQRSPGSKINESNNTLSPTKKRKEIKRRGTKSGGKPPNMEE